METQQPTCYLPTTAGEMLIWTLVSGGAFVLLCAVGLIAFDTAKKKVTVHKLEFVEHLLLHGAFYGSVYSGWIGFGRCGFHLTQVVVSVVLAIVCLLCAYRVGEARAALEANEHNHDVNALVHALNGTLPSV